MSKTIKQAEKISQVSVAGKNSDSPLYSETEKKFFFWMKRSHAYNSYVSSYDAEVLHFFNPKLQFKILNLQLKIS